MDRLPNVYIVVVNWNGWPHTIRCLDSLRRLDYPQPRVTVVDNGSVDDSVAQIRAAHPAIELIEVGSNLGFAGGANVGIRQSLEGGAKYVWVLNNDVEVEPDTLSGLVQVARARARLGIIGPSVWRPPATGDVAVEPAAFVWRSEYRLTARCLSPHGQSEQPFHLVDDVVGSSALLDSTMLQEIGLFDERFFHYWDDVEICARARKAGWLVVHACRPRVWHLVGAAVPTSSPSAQYYFTRNWLLSARWSGRGNLLTMFLRAPRMSLGRILGRRWLLRGRWQMPLAGILGVADALRGRYGQRELPGWLR